MSNYEKVREVVTSYVVVQLIFYIIFCPSDVPTAMQVIMYHINPFQLQMSKQD